MKVLRLTFDSLPDAIKSLFACTKASIECGGGFGWISPPDDEELLSYWAQITSNPRIVVLVATEDDEIVGSIQLILPGAKNEAADFVGELSTFFVHPKHRGRGIGAFLLKKAEREARHYDLTQLNLDVRETQTAAIALYECCGFQRWGTNPRYARIDGTYVSGYYMSKYLD